MQCAYPSCSTKLTPAVQTSTSCPYCRTHVYCSPTCRQLHWDASHKSICTGYQASNTGGLPSSSALDTSTTSTGTDTSKKKQKSLEDFEIINQASKSNPDLGKGSFGQVKLVRDKAEPTKQYAMKVMNKKQLMAYSGIDYLKREIKIQKKLDHPHIIKLHHYFEDKDNVYLILEYAKNGNLFFYLRKKKALTEKEAFVYFFQTCVGIDYLHKKGILHRDLKPENLLLDASGNIKVCDFGWSAEDVGKRNTFCGTVDYMAPEMVQNKAHDFKIDIWSLGILLFELLHGYPPFRGKTANEKFQSILEKELKFKDVISSECKDLITSLLRSDPNDRPGFDFIFDHVWIRKYEKEFGMSVKSFIYDPSKKKDKERSGRSQSPIPQGQPGRSQSPTPQIQTQAGRSQSPLPQNAPIKTVENKPMTPTNIAGGYKIEGNTGRSPSPLRGPVVDSTIPKMPEMPMSNPINKGLTASQTDIKIPSMNVGLDYKAPGSGIASSINTLPISPARSRNNLDDSTNTAKSPRANSPMKGVNKAEELLQSIFQPPKDRSKSPPKSGIFSPVKQYDTPQQLNKSYVDDIMQKRKTTQESPLKNAPLAEDNKRRTTSDIGITGQTDRGNKFLQDSRLLDSSINSLSSINTIEPQSYLKPDAQSAFKPMDYGKPNIMPSTHSKSPSRDNIELNKPKIDTNAMPKPLATAQPLPERTMSPHTTNPLTTAGAKDPYGLSYGTSNMGVSTPTTVSHHSNHSNQQKERSPGRIPDTKTTDPYMNPGGYGMDNKLPQSPYATGKGPSISVATTAGAGNQYGDYGNGSKSPARPAETKAFEPPKSGTGNQYGDYNNGSKSPARPAETKTFEPPKSAEKVRVDNTPKVPPSQNLVSSTYNNNDPYKDAYGQQRPVSPGPTMQREPQREQDRGRSQERGGRGYEQEPKKLQRPQENNRGRSPVEGDFFVPKGDNLESVLTTDPKHYFGGGHSDEKGFQIGQNEPVRFTRVTNLLQKSNLSEVDDIIDKMLQSEDAGHHHENQRFDNNKKAAPVRDKSRERSPVRDEHGRITNIDKYISNYDLENTEENQILDMLDAYYRTGKLDDNGERYPKKNPKKNDQNMSLNESMGNTDEMSFQVEDRRKVNETVKVNNAINKGKKEREEASFEEEASRGYEESPGKRQDGNKAKADMSFADTFEESPSKERREQKGKQKVPQHIEEENEHEEEEQESYEKRNRDRRYQEKGIKEEQGNVKRGQRQAEEARYEDEEEEQEERNYRENNRRGQKEKEKENMQSSSSREKERKEYEKRQQVEKKKLQQQQNRGERSGSEEAEVDQEEMNWRRGAKNPPGKRVEEQEKKALKASSKITYNEEEEQGGRYNGNNKGILKKEEGGRRDGQKERKNSEESKSFLMRMQEKEKSEPTSNRLNTGNKVVTVKGNKEKGVSNMEFHREDLMKQYRNKLNGLYSFNSATTINGSGLEFSQMKEEEGSYYREEESHQREEEEEIDDEPQVGRKGNGRKKEREGEATGNRQKSRRKGKDLNESDRIEQYERELNYYKTKLLNANPRSMDQSYDDMRVKKQQLDFYMDELDFDDSKSVSRPSWRNVREIPKNNTDPTEKEEPGFFSRLSSLFGCLDRNEKKSVRVQKTRKGKRVY